MSQNIPMSPFDTAINLYEGPIVVHLLCLTSVEFIHKCVDFVICLNAINVIIFVTQTYLELDYF